MKLLKRIAIPIVVFVAAIQFWPVDRTNPPVISDIQAPPDIREVLRAACYDCHSNETHYPWYSYAAPVSWLVAQDVHEAREELNFSEWGSIPEGDRPGVAKHIWKEVEDGEMPLLMYRILHSDARLSEDQKNLLRDWSRSPLR